MRRRLELILPIVLIAMWVQLLAPLVALGAVARTASDIGFVSEICHGAASQDDGRTAPASRDDDVACCAICSIGHSGTLAINPPTAAFAHLQLAYQKLAWLDSTEPVLAIRTGSNTRARAPPALS